MDEAREDWRSYLDAAGIKEQIAEYHLKELSRHLDLAPKPKPGSSAPIPVPVPVQAHFEGVVISVMATVDQVAQAINSKLGLGADPGDLFVEAYGKLASEIPYLNAWREKLIGRDLRRIRTRIVHYQYGKVPLSEGKGDPEGWKVEDAGVKYDGSRELWAYGQAAVHHAHELIGLIPTVESVLRRSN